MANLLSNKEQTIATSALSIPEALSERQEAQPFPTIRVAYLTNQYPSLSHTFVRREIQALELIGIEVDRYSVRKSLTGCIDPNDRDELARTGILLDGDILALARAVAMSCLVNTRGLLRALRSTFRIARGSQSGRLKHLAYFVEACYLNRRMRQTGCKHVHAHFGTNSATVALLCHKLGGMTFSFTVHGPEEFDRPEAIGLPEKLATAEGVVAISSFGRSQLYRWTPLHRWDRLHVVHCGLDDGLLATEPSGVPADRRLLFVGRLCEQKGPLTLLDAVAELRHSEPDFELIVVGDGDLREDMQQRINTLGLQQHVRLVGAAPNHEVMEWLKKSRALVLPSFAEGLPVVLMEAFAAGRPVISTYVAGIPELVKPGRNGWLVPAGDVTELAAAMSECLSMSSEQLEAMAHHGRGKVIQRHSATTEARKLAKLFQSVLDPHVNQ